MEVPGSSTSSYDANDCEYIARTQTPACRLVARPTGRCTHQLQCLLSRGLRGCCTACWRAERHLLTVAFRGTDERSDCTCYLCAGSPAHGRITRHWQHPVATDSQTYEHTGSSTPWISATTVGNKAVWQSEQSWSQKKNRNRKAKRWLGHVIRMKDCRIDDPSFEIEPCGMNRKSGRPWKNWQDIFRRDLKDTGLTWDEASELAHSRSSWHQRVVQCVFEIGSLRSG